MTQQPEGNAYVILERQPGDLRPCNDLLWTVHCADGYPTSWPSDTKEWLTPKDQIAAWVVPGEASSMLGHVSLCAIHDHPAAHVWTSSSGLKVEQLARLARLFVSPSHRRTGIGSTLVRTASMFAAEHGKHAVLNVAQTNAAAIELYERLHWQKIGALEHIPGTREIAVFLYIAPSVIT